LKLKNQPNKKAPLPRVAWQTTLEAATYFSVLSFYTGTALGFSILQRQTEQTMSQSMLTRAAGGTQDEKGHQSLKSGFLHLLHFTKLVFYVYLLYLNVQSLVVRLW